MDNDEPKADGQSPGDGPSRAAAGAAFDDGPSRAAAGAAFDGSSHAIDPGRTETVEAKSWDDSAPRELPKPKRRGVIWPWLVALAALLGAYYAASSTQSFVSWLDGQEHAISCSVLPGSESEVGAKSGCRTAMLSPYSSLFRTDLWGGIPVSLPALGVFAFLAAFAIYLGLKRDTNRRDTGFLLLGSLLPVGTSTVFAVISASKLGEFCSTCIGIYIASGATFLLALVGHLRALPAPEGTPRPWGRWASWFFEGVLVVGVLVGIYVAAVPSDRQSVERGCGELVKMEDEAKILLPMPAEAGATPAIAVLDPLCPACRSFDRRLHASELDKKLDMDVLLFPLDAKCNWMVKSTLHPGACIVSEAMLCAPESTAKVLDYVFTEQARLIELGKTNEAALKADLEQRFPEVKGCVGSAAAKAKVNKSLRWAVANALPVMTPQLFVAGTRVCDEDTDLGLEYTLTRMLERRAAGATTPSTN